METTNLLREAIGYLHKFREQTIAVYINENVIEDVMEYKILQDILLLAQAGLKIFICYSEVNFDIALWLKNNSKLKHFNFKDLNNLSVLNEVFILNHVPIIYCEENVFLNLSQVINSHKIIYIGKSALFGNDAKLIRDMPYQEIEKLLTQGVFKGMEERLSAILRLPNKEEMRIHFISCYREGSLLKEILTCQGEGTMLYKNHAYHNIRTAQLSDTFSILRILEESNSRGDLDITLSKENIMGRIGEFFVLTIDGQVHIIAAISCSIPEKIVKIKYLASLNEYKIAIILIKDFLTHLLKNIAMQFKGFNVIIESNENNIWIGISPWFLQLGFKSIKTFPEAQKAKLQINKVVPPLWILKQT